MYRTRMLVSLALVAGLFCGNTAAATFTVSSTGDGAGTCPSVSNCTLRQAIGDANSAGGNNLIAFNIAGSGTHTITLGSTLPGISGALTIDGYTQPGSVQNTLAPDQGGLNTKLMIEVAGTASFTGLQIQPNANLTVQGLALNHFHVAISGNGGGLDASHLYLYGNFIGTKIDGTAFSGAGNSDCGTRAGFTTAQVGGTLPWQRNLLSGNACGVMFGGAATIQGNLIGTDASGTQAIANGVGNNWAGIIVGTGANVHIGGASAAARNVISGNQPLGIAIWSSFGAGASVSNFEIKGNYIGTDWSGLHALPNGFPDPAAAQYGGGIQVQPNADASAFPIGGFADGEANLIAYNTGAGIFTLDNSHANFDSRANAINHNRGVGGANIDIGAAGPTPNDAGDADTGSNAVQNAPEIIAASIVSNALHVTYRVDSTTANSSYPLRIDFYANVHGGSGEYIGQDSYLAGDAQLNKTIVLALPSGVNGIPFVATATNASGYTSEFTAAYDVIFEDGFE